MNNKRIVKSLKRPKNIYFLGLLLIALSLPLSKFGMSVGQFVIIGAWLIAGKLKSRILKLRYNKIALLLAGLWLIHAVGLLYTENYTYALNDMRVKLPLLALPVVMATGPPINRKRFDYVIKVFILAVLAGTIFGVAKYMGYYGEKAIDKRELSVFISHVRFGLMVCLAVFGSFIMAYRYYSWRWFWILSGLWLSGFAVWFGSFTALSVLLFSSVIYFVYLATRKGLPSRMKIGFISGAVVLTVVPSLIFQKNLVEFREQKNRKPLELLEYSKGGERYYHDTASAYSDLKENGYYIWRNIAWNELEKTWNERSSLNFKGKDRRNQNMDATLIRYLASKGLTKDANSVRSLTNEEVEDIENGVASVVYRNKNPIDLRLQKIIWEFDNYFEGGDYNGHSLVLRWVYWQVAIDVWKEHFLIGVGTGDVQDAFDQYYAKHHELKLEDQYKLRAHNQYLTFGVTFGIIGFLFFIAVLGYLLYRAGERTFFVAFMTIALISMFTEDTLETQTGCTFFAFFTCLSLLALVRSRVYLKGLQNRR